MNLKESINFLAQTENGQFSKSGIHTFDQQVIAINAELGLMILAQGKVSGENSPAYKSVEIMLDDMELNLSAIKKESELSVSVASHCMSESLDNINEYLFSQANTNEAMELGRGVEFAAVQLHHSLISCGSVGGLECLIFSANELRVLGTKTSVQEKLGVGLSLQPEIAEQDFVTGDIVLMLSSDLLQVLTQEFIRVTLSRFNENLEMAIRQINTRALQNGFNHKPALIICSMNQVIEKRRSWLGKLRK